MEYANGNIRLIHGDCMDFMRTLPDNAFDLAVVDPPYGDGNFQTPPHKRAMSRDGGAVRQVQTSRANYGHSRGGSGNTSGSITPRRPRCGKPKERYLVGCCSE